MENLFIYHDKDLDGLACAAIALYHFGDEVELKGWDYSYDPDELIQYAKENKFNRIYMADVSLPMDKMDELDLQCNHFIWIDHHKSAIDSYKKHSIFTTHLDTSMSACELTWSFFFSDLFTPKVIQLLGVYDTWRKENVFGLHWENEVLPFQFAMKIQFSIYQIAALIDSHSCSFFIQTGKDILAFERKEMEALLASVYIEKFVFETNNKPIEVKNTAIVNATVNPGRFADLIWKSFPEARLLIQYYRNGDGKWHYSLRSPENGVDCSVIAKAFGGGGHRGAGGFELESLIV